MDGVRSSVGSPVSALIPFMGAPLLWPNHPQQAPPPNTITFGVRVPTREFCRDTNIQTVLLLFSCSVVTDSLRPHGLQHVRLPCPSPSPRVCPSSCPLSQWCLPTISSSVVPFSSSIFPSIGVFSSELDLCISWPEYWSFSFSISPSNDWFDLLAVPGTLKSLLQHHSLKASVIPLSTFSAP